MNINIRTSDFTVTNAMDTHTRQRLDAALHAFEHNVVETDVFMKDVNGNKGGVDKSVVVRVRLRGRPSVAVEAMGGDLYAAINSAAHRTRRAVKRTVKKQNRIQKQSLRDLEPSLD